MKYSLRKSLPLVGYLAIFGLTTLVQAEDIYIAQSALGASTGTNAANAQSASWFHTSGNWGTGAGKISAGDTVHLVGTFTSTLNVLASGTAGNVITIYFEPGAKISTPNSDLLSITGRSYLVIDGGTNGILENTANGTLLANQTAGVKGINASGISNVTIKNLTIRNLYVHPNSAAGRADSSRDFGAGGGVYANGYGAGVVIQNCSFSDICWCITMFGSNGGNLTVTRCDFVNYDHGIGGVATQSSGTVSGFTVTYNHFGSTANWDTTANTYHHDGIHTFWGNGSGGIPNAVIVGNRFDGDWGINNTAHLYFEQNYYNHNPAEASGWLIANNVHIQYPGNYLNNGFLVAIGDNAVIANNTFLGASVPLQSALKAEGTGTTFKNNLIYGVNQFANISLCAAGGLNNNIYAKVVAGGNVPFRYNSVNIASFAAWKAATGQDGAGSQLATLAINPDGSLPLGSAAINAGTGILGSGTGILGLPAGILGLAADILGLFSTDIIGGSRPAGGAWDVGAYEYGAIPASMIAPYNAITAIILIP